MEKETKTAWYYNQGFHGSAFWCGWGAETSSEGVALKDGWYKGMIPHFFREHIFKMLRKTDWLKVALELDGYTFDDSMKKDPSFIEDLKKWVDLGRIEIVDGTYSQPYAFIVSGESNVRQLQYGKEATKRALGIDVKYFLKQEAYFHPQLPQILEGMGYKGVVMRTYWPHYGQGPKIDAHRVLWEGPDGTRIDTVPGYEATHEHEPWGLMSNQDGQKKIQQAGITHPFITTAPDVGGSVSLYRWIKQNLKDALIPDITPLRDKKALSDMLQKQVDDEIRRLEHTPNENTPNEEWLGKNVLGRGFNLITIEEYFGSTPKPQMTFKPSNDEFEYRHLHGAFGDTMTRKNKDAENKLYEAEVFASISRGLGGPCSSKKLDKSWKNLLIAQTHDTFCIPSTYIWGLTKCSLRIFEDYCDEAKKIAENVVDNSMWHICKHVDTRSSFMCDRGSEAIPIVVFNQLSWKRTDVAEVEMLFDPEEALSLTLVDREEEVPCQVVESEAYENGSLFRAKIVFVAEDVPSIGYKVYHLLCREPRATCTETGSHKTKNAIENEELKIELDRNRGGCIKSIYDKKVDVEYLDTSFYYGNELTGLFPDLGFRRSAESKASLKIVEEGPVRTTVKTTAKFGGHSQVSLIHMYENVRRVDFETIFEFDLGTRIGDQKHHWPVDSVTATDGMWNQHDKLRVVFNPNIEKGRIFADMPFAVYGWNKETVLGHNWAEYSDGEKGLAIINTGNLGYYSNPTRNVKLSLILAYGGPARGKGPFYLHGLKRFRYAVYPHMGDWKRAKTSQRALEVNVPLLAIPTEAHKGDLERQLSFVNVGPPNVRLSAMICSPGSKEVTLRLLETEGKGCTASVRFHRPIKQAWKADLRGQRIQDLDTVTGIIKGALRPWGFLTMKAVL